MQTYVIVGAGVAGASAAEALRAEGFDERILLIGEELDPPYQRPPLSKELLRGEVAPDSPSLRAPDFYDRNAIELRLGDRVIRVDTDAARVDCASGAHAVYDKILIATGGAPRQLHVSGGGLPGVHYLRTLPQALELHRALGRHPRVLIIGGGFIGCEVAASARQLGCEVVIAGPTLPMAHALGPQLGAIYAEYHRSHGVELRTGVNITAFRGATVLEEAMLSDGTSIACDLAVVGIGIVPSSSMLGGLDAHDGIATDEFCRTEMHNVFAAGDIARSWRPRLGRRVRLEHFDNAQLQGVAAARSMCGKLTPYDPIPFFWSDQYDWDMQYYGSTERWDEVVLRGQPAQGSFMAFYLKGGRIDAVCAVNRSRDSSIIKRFLGRDGVSAKILADDDAPLRDALQDNRRNAIPMVPAS